MLIIRSTQRAEFKRKA